MCSSVHPLMDIWSISRFVLNELNCCEYLHTSLYELKFSGFNYFFTVHLFESRIRESFCPLGYSSDPLNSFCLQIWLSSQNKFKKKNCSKKVYSVCFLTTSSSPCFPLRSLCWNANTSSVFELFAAKAISQYRLVQDLLASLSVEQGVFIYVFLLFVGLIFPSELRAWHTRPVSFSLCEYIQLQSTGKTKCIFVWVASGFFHP